MPPGLPNCRSRQKQYLSQRLKRHGTRPENHASCSLFRRSQYRALLAGTNKTVSLLVELVVFTDDQANFLDCATMTHHAEVETGRPLNHAPSLQAIRHPRRRTVSARLLGHTTSVRFASASSWWRCSMREHVMTGGRASAGGREGFGTSRLGASARRTDK